MTDQEANMGSPHLPVRSVVIVAALHDELSPLTDLLQLSHHDGTWIGEAGRCRVAARVSGVGASRAGRAMTELIELHGPTLAISLGFVGGLDARLAGGDLVEPRWVIDGKGSAYHLDAAGTLPPQLGADSPGRSVDHTLITVAEPLHTSAEKRREAERSRAAVADMETFHLAAVAARLGVPLWSVRAVSDPADVTLPSEALSWVTPEGRSDAKAAARFVLTHPTWMPVLLRLGRYTKRGAAALAQRVQERITVPYG